MFENRTNININTINEVKPIILNSAIEWPQKPYNQQASTNRYLFISNYAREKIFRSLNWGQITQSNVVEQGGILLGKAYKFGNEIYSSVEDIVLANTTGSNAFVEFTPDMWKEMHIKLVEINLHRAPNDQLIIAGWFHTHPNNLSVFMSGTDMNTQKNNFGQDWQVSLVMNPHKGHSRSFFGANALEGDISFVDFQSIIRNQNRIQRPQQVNSNQVSPIHILNPGTVPANQPVPIQILRQGTVPVNQPANTNNQRIHFRTTVDGLKNIIANKQGTNPSEILNNLLHIIQEIDSIPSINILGRTDGVPVTPEVLYFPNSQEVIINRGRYKTTIIPKPTNDGFLIDTETINNDRQTLETDNRGNLLKDIWNRFKEMFGFSTAERSNCQNIINNNFQPSGTDSEIIPRRR